MVSSAQERRVIRFGNFEVDVAAAELRRNGARVRLQSQPFQILIQLLSAPGEIVTREILRDRLWPADTFVEFDHSLNTAVKKLRQALGDDSDNPRFVETVPRKGYRFIAPVAAQAAAAVEAPAPSLDPLPTLEGYHEDAAELSRRRWKIAAALVTLVLAAASAIALATRTKARERGEVRPRQITTNAEEIPINAAAISPDGKYLAYSDTTGAYLRVVDSGETHPIANSGQGSFRPDSWFPDGTRFVSSVPGDPPSLWQVPLVGSPRKLIENGANASVSPDGTLIAFLRGVTTLEGLTGHEVWLMNKDGSEPRSLLVSTRDWFGSLAWSPDSRFLVFERAAPKGGAYNDPCEHTIEAVASSGGNSKKLLSHPRLGWVVLWLPSNELVYSVTDVIAPVSSTLRVARIAGPSLDLGTSSEVALAEGDVAKATYARGTNTVSFVSQRGTMSVQLANLERNGTRMGSPRRLTLSERSDIPFAWSADSRSVLFSSDRTDTMNIYRQDVEKALPELVVRGMAYEAKFTPRLAPNGKDIVYLEFPGTISETDAKHISFFGTEERVPRVAKVSLTGGPPTSLTSAPGLSNIECVPKGICVVSQELDDGLTLSTLDPESGAMNKITEFHEDLGVCCNWGLSPDGKTIALVKFSVDSDVRLINIEDKSVKQLEVKGWNRFLSLDWSADGKGMFMSGLLPSGETRLLFVDLRGNASVLTNDGRPRWAIPSPNGRELAIANVSNSRNVWFLDKF